MKLSSLDYRRLQKLERALFLLLDILSFALAVLLAQLMRFSTLDFRLDEILPLLWPLLVILVMNTIFDLYKTDFKTSLSKMRGLSIAASFVAFLITTLVIYLMGIEQFVGHYYGRGVLLGTFCGYSLFSAAHRFFLHSIFAQVRKKRHYLVLANEAEFDHLYREGQKFSEQENFHLLAAPYSNLETQMKQTPYVGIIVGSQAMQDEQLIKTLMKLRLEGYPILNMHDFFENVWLKIPLLHLRDQWFIVENGFLLLHNPIGLRMKRILDILFSLTLMLALAPLVLLVAIAIKLFDLGPIFYAQKRTGKRGTTFTLYKFRSMSVDAERENPQWARERDPRVTKIGRILRLTRIDELPQLWNVLKGEMSFIGPRPERPEFNSKLEKTIPYYNLRHLVKPGITGWAQVLYPYGASEKDALEKLQYDLFYLKNYSLLLDFSIIIKTIRVVFFGKGSR